MDNQRREIHYSGHVQGVGFRYTVCQLAGGRPVTGFVRNLPDGRVQVVVEGEPAELDQFLAAVAERMSDFIRDANIDQRPAAGEYRRFEIRHC